MKKPWIIILLALVLYSPLFIFKTAGPLDFWSWMAITVCIMLITMIWLTPQWPARCLDNCQTQFGKMTVIGIASALVLYLVFFTGNWLSQLIFPFASDNIHNVYSLKSGTSSLRVGLLIGLLIGPAEELIWRAYIQEEFSEHMSALKAGLLTVTFYTAIHLGSGNLMLILAALVCGLFWGALYIKFRSVWLNVISHTVWDLAVFLFFPFQ